MIQDPDVGLSERIGGAFLDAGGFGTNIRHPDVGAVGDGRADDGAVLSRLADGYYFVPSGEYRIGSSVRLARGTVLVMARGAVLTVDPGATLTLGGPFQAGLYRIFAGPGRVAFGPGAVDQVYPQWWGGAGDGRGDDTAAIRAALAAHHTVRLVGGAYLLSDTLHIGGSRYLVGDVLGRSNAGGPTLAVHPDAREGWEDGKAILALADGGVASECGVSGVRVQGWRDYHADPGDRRGPVAIDCRQAKNSCLIEHVGIEKCRTALLNRPDSLWVMTVRNAQITKCLEALDWACNNGKFYDVSCRQNHTVGRVASGQNAFFGCHFESESGASSWRLGGEVLLSGCWLESNQHHFEADDHLNLTAHGCHFGATDTGGQPSYEHGLARLDGRDVRITLVGGFIRSSRMGWIYRVTGRTGDVSVTHVNVTYDDVIHRFYWDGSTTRDPATVAAAGRGLSHGELVGGELRLQCLATGSAAGFVAEVPAPRARVTGDGASHTVVAERAREESAAYDAATGRFTAPSAGEFRFEFVLGLDGLGREHRVLRVDVVTADRTHGALRVNPSSLRTEDGRLRVNGAARVPLRAGEVATLTVTVAGGRRTVGVDAGSTVAVRHVVGGAGS